MFCGKCGLQNPNDYSFCSACGFPLHNLQPPPVSHGTAGSPALAADNPAQQLVLSAEPEVRKTPEECTEGEKTNLRGVRGWLLLFCFLITIVHPILYIVDVVNSANLVAVLIYTSLAIFAISTGVSLWRVRSNALGLLRAYFIVLGCTALLILKSPWPLHITDESAESAKADTAAMIQILIWVAIWFWYFTKSKRVKATFGRNL
ncbi:MAG: DUF2569 family protein [Terracidiphilus sp.]